MPLVFSRILLLATLFTFTCNTPSTPFRADQSSANAIDPMHQLLRSFAKSRQLTVVYHEGDRVLMAEACDQLENYPGMGKIQIEWVSDMALHPTDLTGKTVLLVGDIRHHLLEMIMENLPFHLAKDQFTFHGKVFDQPSDVLSLVYPNPVDPKMPLFLLVGNRSEAIYPYIFTPFTKPSISVFRQSKIILEGAFEQHEGRSWQLGDQHWRTLMGQAKISVETQRYRVYNYRMAADQTTMAQAITAWDQQWASLAQFLEREITTPKPIDIYLYKRFADKARFFAGYHQPTRYGNASIRHFSKQYLELHLALETGLDPMGANHLISLLAALNLGEPKTSVLQTGLACLLAPNWGGLGTTYWAARLTKAGWIPSLHDLLRQPEQTKALSFLSQPFAAELVAFLRQHWGAKVFSEKYANWEPTADWCGEREAEWQNFLAQRSEQTLKSSPVTSVQMPTLPAVGKGVNHTFEGFTVERGYLSVRSDAALTHLAEIGANTVAIVPYIPTKRYSPQPLLPLLGTNKENDASIIHAAIQAKGLGMAVLLKPHLEGPWPGHVDMKSDEDWASFFEHYRQMIRHYAVMAEIYGIAALCVGVELVQATKHEAFWRELAHDLRKLYSGKLVYAANWGEEFERITFWDAYDAIGLDCYYPLSQSENPSDLELNAGAAKIIARIDAIGERYRKPVWLTEIGFASIKTPWQDPYREHGKEGYGGKEQARCYQAFISALANARSIKAVWWWKWHSDGRAGPGDKSFSSQDKPAEAVLSAWFAKR